MYKNDVIVKLENLKINFLFVYINELEKFKDVIIFIF
jgi:hypothetical protein